MRLSITVVCVVVQHKHIGGFSGFCFGPMNPTYVSAYIVAIQLVILVAAPNHRTGHEPLELNSTNDLGHVAVGSVG